MGKVYLVGAGPGNPGLITIRGMELLKQCDAVVYDSLSGEELLRLVPETAERIYVGKRAGAHSKKQEEINEILIAAAGKHKRIVRLKGGDPFVFGRGGEEIEALRSSGIPYEAVPGVTSAVAVPELAGIPVTHRSLSRSFHVYTAHTKDGIAPFDYESLAKTEGTLVFLMGLAALEDITKGLIGGGKAPETPAAVVSDGSLEGQKTVRGNLGNIAALCRQEEMKTPATVVVGAVAGLDFQKKKPFTVGITATEPLYRNMEQALEREGLAAVWVCRMELEKNREGLGRLAGCLDRLDQFSWILFTSQNAIDMFFSLVKEKQMDVRQISDVKFGVIGTGSKKRLLSYGFRADFMPSKYDVETLAEEFAAQYDEGTAEPEFAAQHEERCAEQDFSARHKERCAEPDFATRHKERCAEPDFAAAPGKERKRVLIPRAENGNRALLDIFEYAGIPYEEIAIYKVSGKRNGEFSEGQVDCLAFLSSSGVDAFFDGMSSAEREAVRKLPIACIGHKTGEALAAAEHKIVADVMNIEGLVAAIKAGIGCREG